MNRESSNLETASLAALSEYGILDTLPEENYDGLARLAAIICNTPCSLIGLIDKNRVWLKATLGLPHTEIERSKSFLNNNLVSFDELLNFQNSRPTERIIKERMPANTQYRFCTGAPILSDGGLVVGVLAVIDKIPRSLALRQKEGLSVLARIVTSQMEQRRNAIRLAILSDRLQDEIDRRYRAEKSLSEIDEQLRQTQKMESMGLLVSGVAHDFNNLLTAIIGQSELLLERLREDETACNRIKEIKKAGEWAAALTRQLLAFRRKRILEPKVLELNKVVAETSQILKRLIGEDIDLLTVLSADQGTVEMDPAQIEQVLLNLSVNARDAMPAGGQLTIETSIVTLNEDYADTHQGVRPGHYVMLVVTDTGVGMDEETRRRVFEPFFTTKRPGEGTGIGLSTVYGIVKKARGTVWVDSEVGKGTTFIVYLPRAEQTEEIKTCSREYVPSGSGETIVVVEDEPSVREFICDLLHERGYRVLEFSTGDSALKICEKEKTKIKLIISDVVLPGLGGRALVLRLSALSIQPKVLYISGYAESAIVQHGLLEPGVSFLQKPFTAVALLGKIREILDNPNYELPTLKI